MKHRLDWRLGLTLGLLLVLGCAGAAGAQQETLTETFDEPELPGWELAPGARVEEGVLWIDPNNFAARWGEWADFRLELKLQFEGSGAFWIDYRLQDEGHYMLHLTDGGELLLARVGPGEEVEELGAAPDGGMREGAWVELVLVVEGDEHQVLVNGETVLIASDPRPMGPGGLALHAAGERRVLVDEMRVTGPTLGPGELGGGPEEAPPAEGSHGPEMPPAVAPLDLPTATQSPPAEGEGGLMGALDGIFGVQGGQVDIGALVINLLLAALSSYILSRVYIHWGSSLSNRRKFSANLMLITVTTTFIILVVRSSVALSLGLVGALSIVRFRTAVKEPEELAYLFFSIGLGIGFGDNQRTITVLALAAGVLLVGLMRLFRGREAEVNLHLTVASQNPQKVELEQIMAALKPHCVQLKLMRFDESESALETAFLVEFRRMADLEAARRALRGLSEGVEISFLDNRGVW